LGSVGPLGRNRPGSLRILWPSCGHPNGPNVGFTHRHGTDLPRTYAFRGVHRTVSHQRRNYRPDLQSHWRDFLPETAGRRQGLSYMRVQTNYLLGSPSGYATVRFHKRTGKTPPFGGVFVGLSPRRTPATGKTVVGISNKFKKWTKSACKTLEHLGACLI